MWALLTPADRANPGDQPEPVGEQDEDENSGKKPKRLLHQVGPDDPAKEVIKPLHQPLPEILRAPRHLLHVARGNLREDDDAQRDDPTHEHGIGDGKLPDQGQFRRPEFDGLGAQPLFFAARRGRRRRLADLGADQAGAWSGRRRAR